jgi:hypothetical protein
MTRYLASASLERKVKKVYGTAIGLARKTVHKTLWANRRDGQGSDRNVRSASRFVRFTPRGEFHRWAIAYFHFLGNGK